jgi:uncharacterized protein (DUF1015 family)
LRIYPFKAVRAAKKYVDTFSASLYDTESKELSFELNKDNPRNILHIVNPQLFSEKELKPGEFYETACKKVAELMDSSVLMQEEVPAFYIYRQVKKNDVYTGVIGLADIEEYQNNTIKRHELTRVEKEDKMFRYMQNVRVNGNPVLLTYHDVPGLDVFIREKIEAAPEYHFTSEHGTEHMIWVVKQPDDVKAMAGFFSKVDAFYIADGHHRCAAANLLYPEVKRFMACFIPSDQLRVHGFHRYLKDLNGLKTKEFLEALKENFTVQRVKDNLPNKSEGIIGLFIKDKWYEIHIPDSIKNDPNPKHDLDVYILDHFIFGKILGIDDTRTSSNIKYVNGETPMKALLAPIKKGDMKAVFMLNAVSIEDVIHVSDYMETMPPKSTWIEPKMRSGLLLYKF